MDHLTKVFGGADVHSVGMRYTFDAQGNQTGSHNIPGMGAEITSDPAADPALKVDGLEI